MICLDAVVVVIVQIFHKSPLEVFHGLELLQIEQLTFEQAKEVFYDSIVQTVRKEAAAAKPDRPGVFYCETFFRESFQKGRLPLW